VLLINICEIFAHWPNWPMLQEAIQKIKVARFYGPGCSISTVEVV